MNFNPRNGRNIEHKYTTLVMDEHGNETSVEEVELVPEERIVHYIPEGNYKWSVHLPFLFSYFFNVSSFSHQCDFTRGTFEVDTTDLQNPKLNVEISINGKPSFTMTILGKPVPLQTTSGLGLYIRNGIKYILGLLGGS